ncbi:kinase-like domain-containing protein [Rhizoctonia solani]|nr:kinase-like domain-containing protein [Rhizoctonia solani]
MPRFPEYLDDEETALYAEAARTGRNDPWKLTTNELHWAQHQPYLLSKGYQLRPRYRPGWVRSWEGTNRNPLICEDSLALASFKIMDAVRTSDKKKVIIKVFDTRVTPEELPILQHLAVDHLRSNPRNHCAYALDSFPVPDLESWVFVVMDTYCPLTIVPFETVGEVVELVHQVLEGLAFMHDINIAHRDCASANIMMKADPVFGEIPHPHPRYMNLTEDGRERVKLLPRAGRDIRYYFIDFGLSVMFPSHAERRLVTGIEGREREVPELSRPGVAYDPFKLDVCILGRSLWKDFYAKSDHALYFMKPLLERMVATEPADRPTAAEAFEHFEFIRSKLNSRLMSRALQPNLFQHVWYSILDGFSFTCVWFRQRILRVKPQDISLP